MLCYICTVSAGVAQLVERQPSKLNVASSNLVSRSKPQHLLRLFLLILMIKSILNEGKKESSPKKTNLIAIAIFFGFCCSFNCFYYDHKTLVSTEKVLMFLSVLSLIIYIPLHRCLINFCGYEYSLKGNFLYNFIITTIVYFMITLMITIPILNSLYVFNFYGRSKQSKEITCTVKDFLERSSSSDILICDCDDIEITLKRDFDEGFKITYRTSF